MDELAVASDGDHRAGDPVGGDFTLEELVDARQPAAENPAFSGLTAASGCADAVAVAESKKKMERTASLRSMGISL